MIQNSQDGDFKIIFVYILLVTLIFLVMTMISIIVYIRYSCLETAVTIYYSHGCRYHTTVFFTINYRSFGLIFNCFSCSVNVSLEIVHFRGYYLSKLNSPFQKFRCILIGLKSRSHY